MSTPPAHTIQPWESKCWGMTRCTEHTGELSRHELIVEEGGVCSIHFHWHRDNHFIVHHGIVRVVYMHGWQLEATTLLKGDSLCIPRRVAHQFQVLESGEMTELYTGRVMLDDIERLSTGTRVSLQENKCAFILTDGREYIPGDPNESQP